MQFATMNSLDKIKSTRAEAETRNILYRWVFYIIYKRIRRRILKIVRAFLADGHIDTEHMMDIIHTIHIFCNNGILSDDERRYEYMIHTEERDNFAMIRYYIQSPLTSSIDSSSSYREIHVRLTDDEMEVVTTSSLDGVYSEESESYRTSKFVDTDKSFYEAAGLALLNGIKKYL